MGRFRRLHEDRESATGARPEGQLGRPTKCPSCGGPGYLDHLDIGGRYQIQHCRECRHRWETTFDGDGRPLGHQPVTAPDPDDAGPPPGEDPQVIDLTKANPQVIDLSKLDENSTRRTPH